MKKRNEVMQEPCRMHIEFKMSTFKSWQGWQNPGQKIRSKYYQGEDDRYGFFSPIVSSATERCKKIKS